MQSAQPKVILHCTKCNKPVEHRQMEHLAEEDTYRYYVECHGAHEKKEVDATKLEPSSTTTVQCFVP